eukprot:1305289-Pyramimonas_sp.AAC.1
MHALFGYGCEPTRAMIDGAAMSCGQDSRDAQYAARASGLAGDASPLGALGMPPAFRHLPVLQ